MTHFLITHLYVRVKIFTRRLQHGRKKTYQIVSIDEEVNAAPEYTNPEVDPTIAKILKFCGHPVDSTITSNETIADDSGHFEAFQKKNIYCVSKCYKNRILGLNNEIYLLQKPFLEIDVCKQSNRLFKYRFLRQKFQFKYLFLFYDQGWADKNPRECMLTTRTVS